MSIWERVQQLDGKTLSTLKHKKNFKVIGVQSNWIIFIPDGGKKMPRSIGREVIEAAAEMNLGKDNLIPSRLSKEFPGNQNLSYVAAIVHAVTKD